MEIRRDASGGVTYYFDTEEARDAFREGVTFTEKYYPIEAFCSNYFDEKYVVTLHVDRTIRVEFDVVDERGKFLRHVVHPKEKLKKRE